MRLRFAAACIVAAGCGGNGGGGDGDGPPDDDPWCDICSTGDWWDTSDGSDSGPSTTGLPPGPDPCSDVACGAGGVCVVDDDTGLPECDCPFGTLAVGLACLPCSTAEDGSSYEIVGTGTSVGLLVFSAFGPDPVAAGARILLGDRWTKDAIPLEPSDGVLVARVLPGGYDVIYRSPDPPVDDLPRNVAAPFAAVGVGEGTNLFDTILFQAHVRFAVSLDGQPVEPGTVAGAEVWLRSVASDEDVFAAHAIGGAPDAVVVRGDYVLEYRAVDPELTGDVLPRNPRFVLRTGEPVTIDGPSYAPTEIAVDLETRRATGTVTLDGSPPPSSADEWGRLYLVDPSTGTKIPIGATNAAGGAFDSRAVLPGDYVLYYEKVASAMGLVPANTWAPIRGVGLLWPSGDELAIDLETGRLRVDLAIGGQPVASPDDGVAEIWAVRPGGDEVFIGRTDDPPMEATLLTGTYTLEYRVVDPGTKLPHDERVEVEIVDVLPGGPQTVVLDVTPGVFSGSVYLDGDPAPADPAESGAIWLERVGGTGRTVERSTAEGDLVFRVLGGGSFDVFYRNVAGGQVMPANGPTRVGSALVPYGMAFDEIVSLDSRTLSVRVVDDVLDPMPETSEDPRIRLVDVTTGEGFEVDDIATDAPRKVFAHRYVAVYGNEAPAPAATADFAQNRAHPVLCIDLD